MEDADFICRLVPHVNNMIYAPCDIYHYRKYNSSASARITAKKANDIASFIRSICLLTRNAESLYSIYFCKCAEHGFHVLIDYVHSLDPEERDSYIKSMKLYDLALECCELFSMKSCLWNKFLAEGHDVFFAKYKFRNTIKSIKYRIWTKVTKLM